MNLWRHISVYLSIVILVMIGNPIYAQEDLHSKLISDSIINKIQQNKMADAELILILNESEFKSDVEKFNYSVLYSVIAQYNYDNAPSNETWTTLKYHLNKVVDFYFSHIEECENEGISYWQAAGTLSRYYLQRNDYALTSLYSDAKEAYNNSKREHSYPIICQIIKDVYNLYQANKDPGPTMLIARHLRDILLDNNGDNLEIAEAYMMMGDAHFKTSLSGNEIASQLLSMALEYYETSKEKLSSIKNYESLNVYAILQNKLRIARGESDLSSDSIDAYLDIVSKSFSANEAELVDAVSFFARIGSSRNKEYVSLVLVLNEKYKQKGDLYKSESLLLQTIDNLGNGNQYLVGMVAGRLAALYFEMQNYSQGELYADEAMANFGCFDNVGILYTEALCIKNKCRYHQGIGYDVNSIREIEDECSNLPVGQRDTPMALSILNHLQEMLTGIGDTINAAVLLDQIILETSQDDKYRKLHQETIYKKALHLYKGQNYKAASELLSRVIEFEVDPLFFETMYYLYIKSLILAKDPSSNIILERWLTKSYSNISTSFLCMGVTGRDILWGYKSRQLLELSLMNAYLQPSDSSLNLAYKNVLYAKNLKQKSQNELSKNIQNSLNEDLIATYAELNDLTESIAHTTDSISESKISSKIDRLYNHLMLELESLGLSKWSFSEAGNVQIPCLGGKEAAIEFTYIPTKNGYSYGALLKRSDRDCPLLVELVSCDSLRHLLESKNPNQLYKSSQLYECVWKNLEVNLKGIRTIFYSTSGHLNFVNIDAISDGRKLLCERYKMVRLSSTGDIEEYKRSSKKKLSTAALYYGLTYENETEQVSPKRNTLGKLYISINEGEAIGEILKDNGVAVSPFTNSNGTEISFKAFSQRSPSLLHIASHGYYLPDSIRRVKHGISISETDVFNDKAMSCSGIMFSNSSDAWTAYDPNERNDGLLSALELSALDLSSTQLVVLSACETALGDLNSVEGTMGLIRGLKMAGVQTIVITPWDISDDKTAEWMTHFYLNLFKYADIHDAHAITMQQMRQQGWTPRHWAGFIIID